MVAPITPHTRVFIDNSHSRKIHVGFRQAKPYTLTLPYDVQACDIQFKLPYIIDAALTPGRCLDILNGQCIPEVGTTVYNKAYGKFLDAMHDTTSWGINIAQWKQSADMITKRCDQLFNFGLSVIRRDPQGIASSLGISVKKAKAIAAPKYSGATTLSSLWLEFWFGWKPLISDIYGAMEVLDAPLNGNSLKVQAKVTKLLRLGQGWNSYVSERIRADVVARCVIGGDIHINQSDLHLMQQFGVVNPYSVAWDAVPWSFVVGWFVNVEQCIGSYSDFAGVIVSRGYIVRKYEARLTVDWSGCPPGDDWCVEHTLPITSVKGGLVNLQRKTRESFSNHPPPPDLDWKEYSLSKTRALTSISLLTQQLGGLYGVKSIRPR